MVELSFLDDVNERWGMAIIVSNDLNVKYSIIKKEGGNYET
jgi:hypothetical protein